MVRLDRKSVRQWLVILNLALWSFRQGLFAGANSTRDGFPITKNLESCTSYYKAIRFLRKVDRFRDVEEGMQQCKLFSPNDTGVRATKSAEGRLSNQLRQIVFTMLATRYHILILNLQSYFNRSLNRP